MRLDELATLPLTYPEVGATAGSWPPNYRSLQRTTVIGHGRERFHQAATAVMRWGMLRGAGLRVTAGCDTATTGVEVIVGIGPVQAPCRVVYVIDETNRQGFAYGTLPGHPVSGEELFAVCYDPAGDTVHAEVAAFSRPAAWWSRAGGPAITLVQRLMANRYLHAL